jgi:hypothetical protein
MDIFFLSCFCFLSCTTFASAQGEGYIYIHIDISKALADSWKGIMLGAFLQKIQTRRSAL